MDQQQITNIAVMVGNAEAKANFAIWVAIISGIFGIVSAVIAGIFKVRLENFQKQHDKQWAFVGKKTEIFNKAIDVYMRMLWNKLLVSRGNFVHESRMNIFLLQKDSYCLQGEMFVYGGIELARAMSDLEDKIMAIPENTPITSDVWTSVTIECRKTLVSFRNDLGCSVIEKFDNFQKKLQGAENFEDSPAIQSKIKEALSANKTN